MFSPDFLALMKSLDFNVDLTAEQEKFLSEAISEFNAKEDLLAKEFRFNEYNEWNFNQENGLLHLFFDDGCAVEASAEIIASYSLTDNVWEWAWNNPHVEPAVKEASKKIKQLGDILEVDYLKAGMLPIISDLYLSFLCAVSAKAIEAKGVFKASTAGFEIFLALKEIRCLSETETAAARTECEAMAGMVESEPAGEQDQVAEYEPYKSATEFVSEVTAALQNGGVDVAEASPFNLYLYTPSQSDAEKAAKTIEEKLALTMDIASEDGRFLTIASGEFVPSQEKLLEIGEIYIALAEEFDGEFAGWEVNPESAMSAMEDMIAGLMANMGIDFTDLEDE